MGGQGKRKPAAGKAKPDFTRRKAKVGRRVGTDTHMSTNTSFAWTTLKVASRDAADAGLRSHDSFTLKDALQATRAPAADARKDALLAVRNLLAGAHTHTHAHAHSDDEEDIDVPAHARTRANPLASSATGPILAACAERMSDPEAPVRNVLLGVFREALGALSHTDVRPFLPLITAHLQAATSKMAPDVRLDALACLAEFAEMHPALTHDVSARLLECVIALLDTSAHPLVCASTLGSLLPASYGVPVPPHHAGSNPRRKLTNVDARIATAFVLRRLLLGGYDIEPDAAENAHTLEDSGALSSVPWQSRAAPHILLTPAVHAADVRLIHAKAAENTSRSALQAVSQLLHGHQSLRRSHKVDAGAPCTSLSPTSASDALLPLLMLWQECLPADLLTIQAPALQRLSLIAHVMRIVFQACPEFGSVSPEAYAYAEQRAHAADLGSHAALKKLLQECTSDADVVNAGTLGCLWRQLLLRKLATTFPLPPGAGGLHLEAAFERAAAAFHVRTAELILALLPDGPGLEALDTIMASVDPSSGLFGATASGDADAAPSANPFQALEVVTKLPVSKPMGTVTAGKHGREAAASAATTAARKRARAMPTEDALDDSHGAHVAAAKVSQKRWTSLLRGVQSASTLVGTVWEWLENALNDAAPAASQRVSAAARESGDIPVVQMALPLYIHLTEQLHDLMTLPSSHILSAGWPAGRHDSLLNAFSKAFHACHPLSPAKQRGVTFISHCVASSMIGRSYVSSELRSDWVRALPRVLWQIGADHPAASSEILDVLDSVSRRASYASPEFHALRESVRLLTPLLYAVRTTGESATSGARSEGMYGPFLSLSKSSQERVATVLQRVSEFPPPLARAALVLARRQEVPVGVRHQLVRAVALSARETASRSGTLPGGAMEDPSAVTDFARQLVQRDSNDTAALAAWVPPCLAHLHAFLVGRSVELGADGTVTVAPSAATAGQAGVLPSLADTEPASDLWCGESMAKVELTVCTFLAVAPEVLADALQLRSAVADAAPLHVRVAQQLFESVRRHLRGMHDASARHCAAILLAQAAAFAPWMQQHSGWSEDAAFALLHAADILRRRDATADGAASEVTTARDTAGFSVLARMCLLSSAAAVTDCLAYIIARAGPIGTAVIQALIDAAWTASLQDGTAGAAASAPSVPGSVTLLTTLATSAAGRSSIAAVRTHLHGAFGGRDDLDSIQSPSASSYAAVAALRVVRGIVFGA